MIELRKRVLSSGFVVLESRILINCQIDKDTDGYIYTWADWQKVPYVDEHGNPIENPQSLERTG